MPKPAEKPQQPKFPSLKKRCKYCHVTFDTPPTYNGQHQDFCIEAHRKAFHKEGRKPIAAILKRQEKRMREIVREEIRTQREIFIDQIREELGMPPRVVQN
jgi:hypothetical protein